MPAASIVKDNKQLQQGSRAHDTRVRIIRVSLSWGNGRLQGSPTGLNEQVGK